MAETLTESFCERCGTRYEFSAPTRLNPLRKTRGLFGGLKTYLTSQEALSDSIGDAMRVEQGALASAQLDAFHESFNFCIDCRQYTCVNCWNDDSGRCRTCAPVAGADDIGDRVAATLAAGGVAVDAEPLIGDGASPAPLGLEAWPTTDLPEIATTDAPPADAWPTADPLAAVAASSVMADAEEGIRGPDGFVYDSPRIDPEPDAADVRAELAWEPEPMVAEVEVGPEPEPMVAEVEPEPEPMVAEVEPEPEPMVAEVEPEPEPMAAELPPLRVLSWDDDAAYEPEPILAEVEPEPVVAAVEPEPEPILAEVEPEPVVAAVEPEPVVAEVEPEPVVAEVEPEPVVAEVEPEPEPILAEVEPEPVVAEVEPEHVVAEVEPEPEPRVPAAPINETILRFPQRRTTPPPPAERLAAENDAPEVAARRAQLEGLGLGDPGEGPVLPEPPAIVPYRSRGAAVPQGELAARAAAQGVSFWEASAREVASAAATVGIQNCGGCGLSLSANARFCRRCGAPQSQSA
ncbi:MAG TPA: hypothetical protein VIH24_05025 [Candidatus Limnocylindria bacterium]